MNFKHKGRYLIALLIVLLLAKNAMANQTVTFDYHVVAPGENLWEIASSYPHNNIRKFIYDIEKANQMETSVIQSGQNLIIPITRR